MPARLPIRTTRCVKKTGAVNGAVAKKRLQNLTIPHPDLEHLFSALWMRLVLCDDKYQELAQSLIFVRQYVFHPRRKWPFDFAWPLSKVAVEIDGGIFQGGRRKNSDEQQGPATGHRSIGGVMRDMEKFNAAQLLGWRVLRYHSRDLSDRPVQVVNEVLALLGVVK